MAVSKKAIKLAVAKLKEKSSGPQPISQPKVGRPEAPKTTQRIRKKSGV